MVLIILFATPATPAAATVLLSRFELHEAFFLTHKFNTFESRVLHHRLDRESIPKWGI